jgi:hypothetical protein
MPIILFAFAVSRVANVDRLMSRLQRGLLLMPFIQLPFALHQHFIIAPTRTGVSWDAVVGTFGGDASSGGDSPGLALVMAMSVLTAIQMVETGGMRIKRAAAVITCALVVILLGEVKIMILLLPVMIAFQQSGLLRRRPALFLTVMIFGLLCSVGLFAAYQTLYWSETEAADSASAAISSSLEYFFDPSGVNLETGEVSRGASLMLWWSEQVDPASWLFGYGAGSTRFSSAVAAGSIGTKFYPLNMGATAIAQLLWDSGVLGLLLFTLSLVVAFFSARAKAVTAQSGLHRARMNTVAAIVVALIVYLPYNNSLVDLPLEQLVLGFVIGILARYSRVSQKVSHVRLAMKAGRSLKRVIP